jgi:hypothetical protein
MSSAGQRQKSEVLIEKHGLVVLGVHQKREDGRRRLQGPAHGVGK